MILAAAPGQLFAQRLQQKIQCPRNDRRICAQFQLADLLERYTHRRRREPRTEIRAIHDIRRRIADHTAGALGTHERIGVQLVQTILKLREINNLLLLDDLRCLHVLFLFHVNPP